MKHFIAYIVAFALSFGGLLTLTTSADALQQCQRVQTTTTDPTASHFYVKNSLYRKHMPFIVPENMDEDESFVAQSRILSGFKSNRDFHRMPLGTWFCIPAVPVPTHIVLKDTASDPSDMFVQLNGERKKLRTSLPKEDLYNIDSKAADAYYMVKKGSGVPYWYQTNAMYREGMSEDDFNQLVERVNSKSLVELGNLKRTDIIRLPARPPYVYSEGKPEALLTVVDTEKKIYALPEKLPTKVVVAEPVLPRPPTSVVVEESPVVKDLLNQVSDLRIVVGKIGKEVSEVKTRLAELEKSKGLSPPPTTDFGWPDGEAFREGADEAIEGASVDIERVKNFLLLPEIIVLMAVFLLIATIMNKERVRLRWRNRTWFRRKSTPIADV